MKLIVFTGASGVGKDFLLQKAIKKAIEDGTATVVRRSFSDQLREVSTGIFPWLPNKQDQDFKNNPYEHKSNDHGLSPRAIWIKVAKCVREIQDSIFADRLIDNIANDIAELVVKENEVLFAISDLRSPIEYSLTKRLRESEHIDVTFVRILNPEITKENCEDIDKNTFEFKVDHEFINYKTPECVGRFHTLVEIIKNEGIERD